MKNQRPIFLRFTNYLFSLLTDKSNHKKNNSYFYKKIFFKKLYLPYFSSKL